MRAKRFLTQLGATIMAITTMGCSTINLHVFQQADKSSTAVVCIGMENSRFGKCPGAQIDATRMHDVLKSYSDHTVLLTSQMAKKAAVVQAMQEACKKDLAIIFYSGHGGDQKQSAATKQNFVEPTGKDQFLCLYDAPMLDDEIWSIVCGAKGRVVLIFDCCHSGTMFRSPRFFEDRETAGSNEAFGAGKMPDMLCISGCPDESFSYGGADGGLLTNAILESFSRDKTYEWLWRRLHSNKGLNASEAVQFSETGNSFKGYLMFR